jgi:hypothetical protein
MATGSRDMLFRVSNVLSSYELLLLLSFCDLCQGKSRIFARQNANAKDSKLCCPQGQNGPQNINQGSNIGDGLRLLFLFIAVALA